MRRSVAPHADKENCHSVLHTFARGASNCDYAILNGPNKPDARDGLQSRVISSVKLRIHKVCLLTEGGTNAHYEIHSALFSFGPT